MTTYTFTPAQSIAAVGAWNERANAENQLPDDSVHLLCGDNFDYEMEENGCAQIEVSAAKSRTGVPQTFYIMEEEVTVG